MRDKERHIVQVLCLAIGILIFVLNSVQILIIAATTRNRVNGIYAADCEQVTGAYSLAIANKFSEYLNQLRFYSESDAVMTADENQVVEWLREHASSRRTYFSYVQFASSDGMAYADIGSQINISSTDYYKAIMEDGNNEYISNPENDHISGGKVVYICRAAKAGAKTLGVFCAAIPMETIENMISYIQLGKTGRAWIISHDGRVIAHRNENYVDKNLSSMSDPAYESVRNISVKMSKGGMGTAYVKSLDKGNDFVAYTPIPGTNWTFALSVSASEINLTGRVLTQIMFVISMVSCIILVIVAALFTGKILRPLATVKVAVDGIASGSADLTKRIQVKSNNEIGSVVNGFNKFTGKLHSIVSEIKESKDTLSFAGDELRSSAEDTASSITEIISNIDSMGNRIASQAAGVEETAGAVNQIASNIQSLNKMIETQAAGVTQASAAVEEMVGNISAVNQNVDRMAVAFGALRVKADEGSVKQQGVNKKIESIKTESKTLQDANRTIAQIASQTNLLAMNAAIEAAHAGTAGRGFSVVADEIRKLSETSSAQSKKIGEQLKKISISIDSMVNASIESTQVFDSVANGIQSTDQLVKEIKTAMDEQAEGSKQIFTALHDMNDSTSEVRRASSEMSSGNQAILVEVRNLQDSTLEMKESMDEMSVGAKKINETGSVLIDITGKMKDSIKKIGGQIDQFKV